jgi:hypothetical protein
MIMNILTTASNEWNPSQLRLDHTTIHPWVQHANSWTVRHFVRYEFSLCKYDINDKICMLKACVGGGVGFMTSIQNSLLTVQIANLYFVICELNCCLGFAQYFKSSVWMWITEQFTLSEVNGLTWFIVLILSWTAHLYNITIWIPVVGTLHRDRDGFSISSCLLLQLSAKAKESKEKGWVCTIICDRSQNDDISCYIQHMLFLGLLH